MVTIETPVVLGVNFGSSFSSVAVINKEGLPDVIADEDGARQIANAVSFAGEEEYIGIPGKRQLVKNNANTILRFRDLLGKSYDEVKDFKPPFSSAPVIEHQGKPAYRVVVNGQETVLTVHEIAVKFLRTLFNSAKDFLGRKIESCVFAVPADFSPAQGEALQKASAEAGIKSAQLITDVAAAALAYGWTAAPSAKFHGIDRNLLFLDVGASSTTATVVAARQGLLVPLSSVRGTSVGGEAFDDRLVEFFSKEFTKKTKVPLEKSNHRAMMKLLLEVESSKRTLSVSTSANCAVESLAEGMDYSGVVNRMRFDLISSKVYQSITDKALEAVKKAGLDPAEIHEVVLIGGSARLPTLSSRLADIFPSRTSITSELDPDEVIAKGCVLQAGLLTKPSSANISTKEWQDVATSAKTLSKPIGLLLGSDKETGRFAPLLYENSPLPARRTIDVQVPEGDKESTVVLSLWEGKHEIKVEEPAKKTNGKKAADSEDESEDEQPTRTPVVKADRQLVDLSLKVDATLKGEGARAATRSIKITLVVGKDGKGKVTALQNKKGAEAFTAEF